jgi:hypothetical protein
MFAFPSMIRAAAAGGMFVQSEKFALEHEGRIGDIAIYGQESNYTTLFCRSRSCFFQGLQCILHGRIEPLGCARCRSGGITLVAIARADGFEVFTHPRRISSGVAVNAA